MTKSLPTLLKESDEIYLEKFSSAPSLMNSEEVNCCNCGEDLGLESYEWFSEGYEMAAQDIKSFLHSQIEAAYKAGLEEVKEACRKIKKEVPPFDGFLNREDHVELAEINGFNSALTAILDIINKELQ